MARTKDTYSYKGWLVSDFLIKRAFAVWGHYVVAGIIMAVIVVLFTYIFGIGLSFLFR